MKVARQLVLVALAACSSAPTPKPDAASSTAPPTQSAPDKPIESTMSPAAAPAVAAASTVDLCRERELIEESDAARNASDYDTARAKVAGAVASLLARPEAEQDAAWAELLYRAGRSAWDAQDARLANAAWQRVFNVQSRALPDDHPDLQKVRQALAITINQLGDLVAARALQEKVLEVRSRTLPDDHPDLQAARQYLGGTLYELGDLAGARALAEKVLEVRLRTLPDEHSDLQRAREILALTMHKLGDLAGARVLFEKLLEVNALTLPDGHPNLQRARQHLALTIKALGDLRGARALEEKILEVLVSTLPDEHADLQLARQNLAITTHQLGDLAGARALFEKVLEVRSSTLADDHPDLQIARQNLAATLHKLGDLAGARALEEKVLDVRALTLPDDHPHLQMARQNLAATTHMLGDLSRARALEEKVLEVRERGLPDDHSDLQAARQNLAVTVKALGDLAGARVLEEKVLEVRSRTLPDDHPDLQAARQNLAGTIKALGDLAGARALEEKVLEVRARTLPDDHPDLQAARLNLAATIKALGDLAGARALEEKSLEVNSRTLPDDHPDLQGTRQSLAATLYLLGEFTRSRALVEKVLESRLAALPDNHPDLQAARQGLAATCVELGDLAVARALGEKVLEVNSRALPDDHPDLQSARNNLAVTIASEVGRADRASGDKGGRTPEKEAGRERCAALISALCRAQVHAAHAAILASPRREAEERCSRLAERLDASLSFASGYGAFEPLRMLEAESFVLSETTRAAAIIAAELERRAADSPEYGELSTALRRASEELSHLAQKGTTRVEFDRALTVRESVERELVALAREFSGGRLSGVELEVHTLTASLQEREVAAGFRRFKKSRVEVFDELDFTGQPALRETSVDSLCAFVVRNTNSAAARDEASSLTLVDLGPIAPIEAAVKAWRDGLGVALGRGVVVEPGGESESLHAKGAAIRRLVFDPLRTAMGDAQHVIVALDDVLHLVPFDALPADDSATQLVGDVLRIETRATLTELLDTAMPLSGANELVGLGGAAFDLDEVGAASSTLPASSAAHEVEHDTAGILRGGAWTKGFTPLPGTLLEIEGVQALFLDAMGAEASHTVLRTSGATKQALAEHAPRARWLHLATHGWYASESIRSWNDSVPIDKLSGLGMRMSGEEQMRGMSPMLLCGLALAGANLPENTVGRVSGLVTADEISSWDLTNCELAVLSACDTNVGERRAGQGVASLQKALQMAGARSVITSLWKVPDEATKELMLDFYRRLWIEKKPKWQALWEAKMKLRDAKDADGRPLYSTRDWAAWVLTGEPD